MWQRPMMQWAQNRWPTIPKTNGKHDPTSWKIKTKQACTHTHVDAAAYEHSAITPHPILLLDALRKRRLRTRHKRRCSRFGIAPMCGGENLPQLADIKLLGQNLVGQERDTPLQPTQELCGGQCWRNNAAPQRSLDCNVRAHPKTHPNKKSCAQVSEPLMGSARMFGLMTAVCYSGCGRN